MVARSTMLGAPSASRKETSASPVLSVAMASAVSNAGFGAEGHRSGADGLLVKRRVGAQGVLDAVAELPQNAHGNVCRGSG